jgi:ubiquitin conjugation factor E4 B
LTAILATSEELRHLQAEEASTSTLNNPQSDLPGPAASKPADHSNFSFICECFFLTARVLNLGLIKALLDFKTLVQVSTVAIYLLSTYLGLLALADGFSVLALANIYHCC